MAAEEDWVGTQEVVAHLRVAKESIRRWIDSKGFPAHRVGRLLRFRLSEVDEFVTTADGANPPPSSSTKASQGMARLAGRKSGAKKKEDV